MARFVYQKRLALNKKTRKANVHVAGRCLAALCQKKYSASGHAAKRSLQLSGNILQSVVKLEGNEARCRFSLAAQPCGTARDVTCDENNHGHCIEAMQRAIIQPREHCQTSIGKLTFPWKLAIADQIV
jgi:hypothetical protein